MNLVFAIAGRSDSPVVGASDDSFADGKPQPKLPPNSARVTSARLMLEAGVGKSAVAFFGGDNNTGIGCVDFS